ncbi:MAG: ABC transporter permease [Clostridia bacterium]|nr:ABC transporter permease [Clostridia bacterium]
MRLFIKHILRSIKKAPLQPIIIFLTLTLAISSLICAEKLFVNIAREESLTKRSNNYTADITVKLSKSDDVRLLFDDDAKEIVADSGKVLSEFGITALTKRDEKNTLIKIVASDLKASDDFYQFRFYEYGNITNKNLNSSVIISKSTAQKYGLKLYDTLTLTLLNKQLDLTVQAIAEDDGALYDYAALVNIGAVSEAITEANPSIAAFADTLTPGTELKIRLNDQERCDELVNRLKSDERFEDKLIIKESENHGNADFISLISIVIVSICIVIVAIISVIVILTSLDLLTKKRLRDSALFMLCGASKGQLNLMLYLECGIYALASAIPGILLSIPMNRGINNIFAWKFETVAFQASDLLIAFFGAPLLIFIAATVHALREKELSVCDRLSDRANVETKRSSYTAPFILAVFTASALIMTSVLETKNTLFPAIIGGLIFIGFVYFVTPCFATSFSALLIKLIQRKKKIPPKTMLALKNANISYPLKHCARLISLLLMLAFSILSCLISLTDETNSIISVVDAEYVSVGAGEKTDEMIESIDGVDDSFRMAIVRNLVTKDNTGVVAISIDEDAREFLNDSLKPSVIPTKNEIVIPKGLSLLLDVNVGDSITLTSEANKYNFTVIEVLPIRSNIVFLDAASLGKANDLLCIKSTLDIESEQFTAMANALELRGATVVELNDIVLPVVETVLKYEILLMYTVLLAFIITAFAVANVLFYAYTVRKDERDVYYTTGMTRRGIRATVLTEILIIMAFAVVLVPIFTLIFDMLVDLAINSFGFNLFRF